MASACINASLRARTTAVAKREASMASRKRRTASATASARFAATTALLRLAGEDLAQVSIRLLPDGAGGVLQLATFRLRGESRGLTFRLA